MKTALTIALITISTSSFAITTPKLIEACRAVGVAKIMTQAKAYRLQVKEKNIHECGVDNRPLSPSSYVWFCGFTSGGEKEISVMTQKPAFKDCF